MKIRVYQINKERDINRVCFLGYEDLERFQETTNIDSKIYDMVYESDVECNSLEDVFQLLNRNHPQGYYARSLAVSDIIEVISSDAVIPGFYFCDYIGFKQVEFEPNKTQECFYLHD